MYRERIDTHNAKLARYEQIKNFTLLPKEFSIDAGELTPTMKTRRRHVLAAHRAEIEAMYAEASAAS